jgi:hypothetical protein
VSGSVDQVERRARKLVRWYPKAWRARYGDEFTELLIAEFEEQPRSWRRMINVISTAGLTRLVPTGLTGHRLEPTEQVRSSVVSFGCALAAFLAFGVAMWSQITIGWQWSRPDTTTTTTAMVVMSSVMLVFLCLAVLAAVPIVCSVAARFARRRQKELVLPTILFVVGMALLIVGGRHFGNGWPGTGGHPWSSQGLVPGGLAAFTWVSTLSVSSYWMHPAALSSFPTAEVAWMVVSPLAIANVVIGAAMTVRRLDLSPRILRFEARLGVIATIAMVLFLTGCCYWIIDGGTGPRNLFHVGAIDVIEVVMMGMALVVAHRAVQGSRGGSLLSTSN